MTDTELMKLALSLAERGSGRVSPNPLVGCVIARDGKPIAEGWHPFYGGPHAERMAINNAIANGVDLKDSTLYVTLEPCAHHGKTPPCTDAIISHGIKRVVIAARDQNPIAQGGIHILQGCGIKVEVGLLEKEALLQNESFFYCLRHGMPLVTWKVAATLDGCVTSDQVPTSSLERKISGATSHTLVHKMRHRSSAIMVGSGTVKKDNPLLTDRSDENNPVHPLRVVVGHHPETLLGTKLFATAKSIPTLFATTSSSSVTHSLAEAGIEVLQWSDQDVPLKELMFKLAKRGINSVLLEGGSTLAAAMFKSQLVHKIEIFFAPKLLGSNNLNQRMLNSLGSKTLADAIQLEPANLEFCGEDIHYTAYVRRSKCLPE